jgi:glycosyltransferase involved in cell wall biosynthesis
VIPCYNEAHRLDVASFRRFLDEHPGTVLIFVDDGSQDETVSVLERVRDGHDSAVEILHLAKNGGKAEAVRAGIVHALDGFEPMMVGFWDADLATPLASVEALAQILERQPQIEMVFGARVKLLGRHVERRAVRHYLGRLFATLVSGTLKLPIYDSQCGAKLFRVTAQTREVFAQRFLSKWVFDVEILARYLLMNGGNSKGLERIIYEYPLEIWTDVAGSKVGAKDFFTALLDIVRIRYKYLS